MTVRTILPDRPAPADAARSIVCPLCRAPEGSACAVTGSHLSRWLRAFALGLIDRADLTDAVGGLVVVSASQLVPERAA